MFNVGGGEILLILLVALLVLGPNKLPGAARQIGAGLTELRRMSSGFQRELKEALNDVEAESQTETDRSGPRLPPAEPVKNDPEPEREPAQGARHTPTRPRSEPASKRANEHGPPSPPPRSAEPERTDST